MAVTARRTLRALLVGVPVLVLVVVLAGLLLGGLALSPVLSGSMEPTMSRGDAVLVKLVDTGDLRVGDVPVVVPPGQSSPVAHRIERVDAGPAGPVLLTRGDANDVRDAWRSTVTAPRTPKVVAVVPHAGHAQLLFGRLPARPFLVGLAGVLLTALAVRAVASSPAPPEPVPAALP